MAALPSPHLRAPNPFPKLWVALIGMGLLTVVSLGLSIGQWQRPIAGMLVDPFGIIDNFGWPGWSGFQQGLAYPDRVVAVDEHTLVSQHGATLDVLAAQVLAATPPGAGAARPIRVLIDQGAELRAYSVRAERLGFAPWLLLSGVYLILAWVWLCAAGLIFTARPQSRAVGAFVRWVIICGTLLITLFDFHTTRKLVPITLIAFACLPAALIEFGLCFPERVPTLQARPQLLYILRGVDAILIFLLVGGYLRGHNLRFVTDLSSAAAIVALTVILSLRAATAQGRRRKQLLLALLVLLPIYLILGTTLLWTPERAAPYLFVLVIPLTVFGALGMTFALLRYDLWDSRTLLRRPGVRPMFTAALSFVVSLLCTIGFIAVRGQADVLPIVYMLLVVALAGPLVRRAAESLDSTLFTTEVHYRDTVEQLSLRFTDMSSQAAVSEAVEQAVRQVVDCARVRLLPVSGALWTPGTDSAGIGKFLPKVAQAMAAAIANEHSGERDRRQPERKQNPPSGTSTPNPGISSSSNPTPVEGRNLRALRRVVKTASLFALSPEQEAALASGELVYLTPKASITSSVPALWSWLLIAVRFRDRIVGLLAVAPKSVAQIFTQTSESLLRTVANQAALALYCASVSEQFEALRRAQEGQSREQLDAAVAALADEIAAALAAGAEGGEPPNAAVAGLLAPLRALATPRALRRQPLALRPLLERARQLLRDRLATRLLEVDLPPALEVDSDSDALIQVLSDLLANALDACAAPGRVGVTASVESDQRLRLCVWDSGPGPLVEGERLLPLVSAKDKRTAAFRQVIAHRLVQAHGWELTASRRSDRNSTEILVPTSDWRRRRTTDATDDEDEASAL